MTSLPPQAFVQHGLRPVRLLEEHGTISDSNSSWQMKFSTPLPGELNQISSIWRCRIKTKASRGRVCMAGVETRNWCISNTSYVENSAGLLRTLTGFPLIWPLEQKRESVAETNLSCLQVNFFTRRPCLQPTVKIPWTWAKDDIHTLPSQHKPPCTGKLQNRCQAIRLHSGGPFQKTWLSVDMVYLSCLVLCFQLLLLSLAALVFFLILIIPEHLTG